MENNDITTRAFWEEEEGLFKLKPLLKSDLNTITPERQVLIDSHNRAYKQYLAMQEITLKQSRKS